MITAPSRELCYRLYTEPGPGAKRSGVNLVTTMYLVAVMKLLVAGRWASRGHTIWTGRVPQPPWQSPYCRLDHRSFQGRDIHRRLHLVQRQYPAMETLTRRTAAKTIQYVIDLTSSLTD